MIRRERPGAKARAVFVYFMGAAILAGSSGQVNHWVISTVPFPILDFDLIIAQ